MSVNFFNQVLHVLRKRVSFESQSNLLGRTLFDEKAGKSITEVIESVNPFSTGKKRGGNAIFNAINSGAVKIPEASASAVESMGWLKDAVSLTKKDKKEES